jgi:hypothetical protein
MARDSFSGMADEAYDALLRCDHGLLREAWLRQWREF